MTPSEDLTIVSEVMIKEISLKQTMFSVGALATAILLLEGVLVRLLAVAQFYHFAFLVVSLALLGFGASGTLLSISPRLRAMPLARLLAWVGFLFRSALGLPRCRQLSAL